jgi:hypothetical protein
MKLKINFKHMSEREGTIIKLEFDQKPATVKPEGRQTTVKTPKRKHFQANLLSTAISVEHNNVI